MTAYFDTKSSELDDTSALDPDPESYTISEALERIEHEMVRDVTLAAELPGCPASIRDAIHRTVAKYGVASQDPRKRTVDDNQEWRERLNRMQSDLHSHFHAFAQSADHRQDNPRVRVSNFLCAGDEYRERLADPPDDNAFRPDWAVPPWEAIVEALEAKGVTETEFFERTGIVDTRPTWGAEAMRDLWIDEESAARIAAVAGHTPEFWIRFDHQYRESTCRLRRQRAVLTDTADYLKNIADNPDLPRGTRDAMRAFAETLTPKDET